MTDNPSSQHTHSSTTQADGPVRWLLASALVWAIAGFLYPFISLASFNASLGGIQNLLTRVLGLPEQLAFRLTFSVQTISLTVLLGGVVAAGQCILLRSVRPWTRRWVLAAAGGAIASSAVWLLVSLTLTPAGPAGSTSAWMAMFRLLLRGALLGAFIAISQRWAMRGRVHVPGYFVLASLIAAGGGTVGTFFLMLSALRALR